ncbi:MAG: outer membrane protein assembly factor BamB family protein [Caulobacteraceae bacterium]
MQVVRLTGLAAMIALATGAIAQAADTAAKAAPAKAAKASKAAMPAADWRAVDRDLAQTRFSPLTQINRTNVASLKPAWTYPMKGNNTASPLVVGGVMYLPAGSRVVALDADTGQELWSHTEQRDPKLARDTVSGRGVGYWPGDASHAPRILVMRGTHMFALDAKTGDLVKGFGDGGYADVGVAYGGTPTISGNIAVIGAAALENPIGVPGNSRAFDVVTGKKVWEFQSVPAAGQIGHETWLNDGWWGRSGTNQWGFSAPVDEDLGVVYLPIGNPSHNYWGGDRPGNNLFGNSIVAVDVKTGKYRWHFQTVHHDLWDIDQPSDGPLLDVTIGGQKRKIVTSVNKSGLWFAYDRVTGKPAFPVEERPVPKGDVPGEWYSPTQPFPVKTPPLSRMSFKKEDIVTAQDTTPEHAAACQAMYEKAGGFYNVGPYTPFLFHKDGDPPKSTIQVPGGTGGVNWGGGAADPRTGWVYYNAHDTSLVGWVEKKADPMKKYSFDMDDVFLPYDRASVDGKGPFFSFSAPISGKYDDKGRGVGPSAPCYKGPWARLTAVDANTGEIKFAVPLGLVEALPEGKQLQGDSGSAGPSVTAGGLVFVGATSDRRIRAFDSSNGKELWQAKMTAEVNSNPISYGGKSGKQYVAVNAGGVITTFSLP